MTSEGNRTRKIIYLVLCILGVALPYSQFLPWVLDHHGVNLRLFFHELFANRIGGFFGMDVFVSAVALIGFIRSEGARLKMRALWVPIVGVLLIGVSLGLPLFLYQRETTLEQLAKAN